MDAAPGLAPSAGAVASSGWRLRCCLHPAARAAPTEPDGGRKKEVRLWCWGSGLEVEAEGSRRREEEEEADGRLARKDWRVVGAERRDIGDIDRNNNGLRKKCERSRYLITKTVSN